MGSECEDSLHLTFTVCQEWRKSAGVSNLGPEGLAEFSSNLP